ncbi:ABC-type Na+ efflux pump, permease component [Mesotoga prima MesG1.Ag.4.2]|uniref:ABC-type Na+ efflux pump, permease component n=1 Tax=Mesotoga prima MesG1.Ag.4.2 TaxID=660470 RepID=I2F770_9BACT|nr:ABC transporter permease [Mesotoga prima]AFK07773.1 ABC-type Na+ efflux pump, permease component [Mesotoga prima MesG1.Ag.4.2]
MFRDALIIFRKELKNVFKDPRTIFAVLILPMLIMPVIFLVMNAVSQSQAKTYENAVYSLKVTNLPDERFLKILEGMISFEIVDELNEETVKDFENSIVVEFPPNSAERIENGERIDALVFYNSTSRGSAYGAQMVQNALASYSSFLLSEKLLEHGLTIEDLNPVNVEKMDVAPEESQGTEMLATLIPYFLLIYIFAGAMNIGLDTTAGEKERGSMPVLLVNQVSRSSIATGKILYVMTIAILNSIFTFIGLIIAFKLGGPAFGAENLNLSSLSASTLVGLFITLLTMSGVAAALIVLLGSIARNVKEGSGYVMPIYIMAIVLGIATMQMESPDNPLLYLIPLVNSIFVMKDIITVNFVIARFLLMLISNLAYVSIFIYFLTRVFNSERIMDSSGS